MRNDDADDLPETWDDEAGGEPAAVDPGADAHRLRAAWIAAVRELHYRREGEPSRYTPKPIWDGGTCRQTGRTYKAVWPGLAARARQMGLDPVDLVQTLFSHRVGATPAPHAMFGEDNVAACRRAAESVGRRAGASLVTEEAVFRSAVWAAGLTIPDRDAAVRFVLNDVGRTMSALFRYCVAVVYGLPEVAARWRTAAVAQYRKNEKAYNEHWGRILPADLVTARSA